MKDKYILIVEDEDGIREMLQMALTLEGYSTLAASNGKEALQLLASAPTPPALILLDLMMPIMDGPQFVEHLNKEYPTWQVPILVVTAYPHKINEVKCNAIIKKPVDLSHLFEVVNQLL
jgi:two-component system, chemotaxis family, chemotaxis protein CheY